MLLYIRAYSTGKMPFWSLESISGGEKRQEQQRDTADAAAGASCAPDELFGSRLPRCSCLDMAQQSHCKKHTNRTEPRNAVPVVPIGGAQRRRRLSFDRELSVLVRVVCLLWSFKPGDAKPHVIFQKTPHHMLSKKSQRGLQVFFGIPFFLGSS